MRDRTYGLGIDVGDSTVVAAVCRHDGDQAAAPELLPLGRGAATGSAAVALVGGRLSVLPPPGPAPAGALVEHVVRRVGAPTPLLGSSGLSAAAAVAAIAVRAHELATRREGGPAAWSVLTVPPSWGSHRRDLLATALSAAGLPRSSVVSAAEAVVRRLVAAGTLPAGATVAVYDLGAGSLDTAVLRTTAGGDVEQLAVPPAPLTWGGRDLDDAVVGHVVGSLPGGAAPTHPAERAALRRACTAAKEALSTETDVRVDVRIDGVPAVVRVVREDVEDLVAGAVEASVDVLRSAVAAAGLPVEDLAAVVLAGGSTRVPLVAETLSAELGRPLLTDREPASSAACGAALLAVQQGATVQQAAVDAPGDADAVDQPAADAGGIDGVEDHGEAGTGRPLPRRLRRPPSAVDAGDGSTTVRRHLQRAAVLTTAVLALWAGSASLVTLVDPEGAGAPLGASTADADAEPARGPAPADAPADPAGGDVPAGSLTPAALERASAGDGDPRSAPSSGVTPGTATRAAAGAVRSPSSSPGPAPAGSSTTSGGSGPTPGTPTAPQPGTGTGTATGGEAPVPTPPGGTSTPPAGPSVEPGPDPDPDPEPKPEPEPTTDPEPTPPDPRPTPPDPQPDPVDPPASTTSPADVGAAAGQAA